MKVVRALSICTFLLALVAPAFALNPNRDIHQLAHRSWGEKEGYPGRSEALAQTTDGFLWIGTDVGLFRFDGIRFELYVPNSGDQLPEERVRSLLARSDGSLWIAYRYGKKICVLRNGNVKCYGDIDGVTSNGITLVQDHESAIWAKTETGLIRFNGTRWEHIGGNWNFPDGVPHLDAVALFVDSRGTLWTGVNQTILYLKQGSKRFAPTGVFAGYSYAIAEAPDGTIWVSDEQSYVRPINTSTNAKSASIARCEVQTPRGTRERCPGEDPQVIRITGANNLIFDRNGSLWIATDTSGVFRVPHPELLRNRSISKTSALQRFTSKDGLSADNGAPILEDREGNIWVATRDGLDQFRDTALGSVTLPTSIAVAAIAPADGGDIWIAGSWGYIGRIHGDARDLLYVRADAFKPYRDPAGVTWLMGNSLGRWEDGRFRKVAESPDGLAGSAGDWQVAGDRFGTLWAFSNGRGFLSLEHHRWKAWATPPEVSKQRVANMFADSTGRIWVSTYEGDVITMERGSVMEYPLKRDSPLKDVKAFAERAPQEIWAGGAGGLVLIDKGHFRSIKPAALDSLRDVTGIVDTGSEGLWLNAIGGVIHISRDEVDRALRDASYRFRWERFDSSDGLNGQTQVANPYPKAIQGTDGRVWFTTTRGVAWVDPKYIPRNEVPPPVAITSVFADGSSYPRLADLRLPAHTANVQINYTALSLSAPERVRFRYKLDGIDKGWRNEETLRQADYGNLGPGSYLFRVVASNNNGVWNNTGASLQFSIAPAFHQTYWFRSLCGIAAAGTLWLFYLFRMKQATQKIQERLGARLEERERIARELHDTLLQGFQGLVLRLQAVLKTLPAKEPAHQLIEKALDKADEVLLEGRQRVRDLREEGASGNELSDELRTYGTELEDGSAAVFNLSVVGTSQALSPIVFDEICRIAREALFNAFQHSKASRIEAELKYENIGVCLGIRDNGIGLDERTRGSGRPGHWGLAGLRERAEKIGGKLIIRSSPGIGTEIELIVPAKVAYRQSQTGSQWERIKDLAGAWPPRPR
jgi:signal transduction histidine kinase/ligand-binding sensor domain-containing protein